MRLAPAPRLGEADIAHMLTQTSDVWPALTGTKILMCGGTGFVGTWLLEAFVAANRALSLGTAVTVVARRTADFYERSAHLAADPAVTLLAGDVADADVQNTPFDAVIHLATASPVPGDPHNSEAAVERDAQTTQHILDLAVRARARYTLFTSSGAIYGPQPPQIDAIDEKFIHQAEPPSPSNAYARGKRRSEELCAAYAERAGIEIKIARLFTFAGPLLPLDAGYAFGNFLRDALAGRAIAVGGDGTAYRSYLYAADLAIWLWSILIRGRSLRPYNVGSERAVSIGELARTVAATVAPHSRVTFAARPVPGARPARYVPDTGRARRELGLTEEISLRDSIARTYEYHRAAR